MILFGTRGINRNVGEGRFFCPRCSSEQQYTHKAVKRFFTLYFIPLIPMGTAGEFVECQGCAGTFAMEILTYDPEVERKKTVDSFRRMAVAFLIDVNRCKVGELEALRDIVGDVVGEDIESETVALDVRQAQEAGVDIVKFVRNQASDLSDDGKWLMMATMRQILEPVGSLMPDERERLMDGGQAMGLRKKHVNEFLDTPLEQ